MEGLRVRYPWPATARRRPSPASGRGATTGARMWCIATPLRISAGSRTPWRPPRSSSIARIEWFLTQMCARFSPQQVSHAVERGCGCARARESAVKSSIAQSTAACTGPAFGGGPARRQPVPPQGAEALAFTGQRTMNTRGTRPGLSPTFYRWAEPSLTVQPLGTGRPLVISAVYRGPDFPRACSSSPDTDGVLQPRKSMTMFDLLAMEPAKAAPIPERNQSSIEVDLPTGRSRS